MEVKKSYVAGMFYPNSASKIEQMITYFNSISPTDTDTKCSNIRAMIVPHAGYIYSGYSANLAFRELKNQDIKTLVVIGPSHKVYFDGISVAYYDQYETPFGDLVIDKKLISTLISNFDIHFYPKAHQEHSTEVQMPFIKYYLPNVKIVELVYSNVDTNKLAHMIDFCLQDDSVACVISSDLSHFYDIDKAKELDTICLKAISSLDEELLHQGCEACGKIGIEALLIHAKSNGLIPHILNYTTSADTTKDTKEVVGYMSALFCKE